jgi:hypothetical protein
VQLVLAAPTRQRELTGGRFAMLRPQLAITRLIWVCRGLALGFFHTQPATIDLNLP